jgi:hypothetical protein
MNIQSPKPPCLIETSLLGISFSLVPATLQTLLSSRPCLSLVKRFANNRAPLLLRHYSDSSLLQAHPPPSCHSPISQRLLVIGSVFSGNFLPGQVGLLQLLSMSLLPCCRYHPAGIEQTNASLVCLYCLHLQIAGSTSRVFRLRGHLCVYLRYGLVTCSSPIR